MTPTENIDLTLCATSAKVTDLTDVTYSATTNAEFLAAIFTGLSDPQRPFTLGFSGKPKERKAWGGDAWRPDKTNVDNPALNWYFSLATYTPDADGYRRRE